MASINIGFLLVLYMAMLYEISTEIKLIFKGIENNIKVI